MIEDHLQKLGYRCEDKITGFKGVLSGVCFDLYGCIQVTVTPTVDKDGKQQDARWYDIGRINITSKNPVMDQPFYLDENIDKGLKGACEKTIMDNIA